MMCSGILRSYSSRVSTPLYFLVVFIPQNLNLLICTTCVYEIQPIIIATCLDWLVAFDHQDPILAIIKFIQLGVRPSLIPLLASYLTDRKIKVKFNGEMSAFLTLIGGGPQGTLLGGL